MRFRIKKTPLFWDPTRFSYEIQQRFFCDWEKPEKEIRDCYPEGKHSWCNTLEEVEETLRLALAERKRRDEKWADVDRRTEYIPFKP